MYSLNDKLHFGKYDGFTIKDIYCGQKHITQQFLNDFLHFKFNDLKYDIIDFDSLFKKKSVLNVEIKNFEILINNELSFELILKLNNQEITIETDNYEGLVEKALEWVEFDFILDDRIEAKDAFDSSNSLIEKINNKNLTSHKPSSDASYINWCIKNLDIFYINPKDFSSLQNENCYHFYG
jgi:hypothetical protein